MTDLRTAAQQALEALELHAKQYPHMQKGYTVDAITVLRAALEADDGMYGAKALTKAYENGWNAAKAEPVQEPVAWYFEARHIDSAWAAAVTMKHPGPEGKYMRKVTPLYTALPPRKPLTEEEIRDLWSWAMTAEAERTATTQQHAFARAIERAHGIGGNDGLSVS